MRGARTEVPNEGEVGVWYWRGDVAGRVSQTDWEYLCFWRRGDKRGTEAQDASSVGCGAFWQDDDAGIGVVTDESGERNEASVGWRSALRWKQRAQYGLEEGDMLDETG